MASNINNTTWAFIAPYSNKKNLVTSQTWDVLFTDEEKTEYNQIVVTGYTIQYRKLNGDVISVAENGQWKDRCYRIIAITNAEQAAHDIETWLRANAKEITFYHYLTSFQPDSLNLSPGRYEITFTAIAPPKEESYHSETIYYSNLPTAATPRITLTNNILTIDSGDFDADEFTIYINDEQVLVVEPDANNSGNSHGGGSND